MESTSSAKASTGCGAGIDDIGDALDCIADALDGVGEGVDCIADAVDCIADALDCIADALDGMGARDRRDAGRGAVGGGFRGGLRRSGCRGDSAREPRGTVQVSEKSISRIGHRALVCAVPVSKT